MKTVPVLLVLAALALAVPVAEAHQDCSDDKIVAWYRCPWPGGVGEFCIAYEDHHVCFGPI